MFSLQTMELLIGVSGSRACMTFLCKISVVIELPKITMYEYFFKNVTQQQKTHIQKTQFSLCFPFRKGNRITPLETFAQLKRDLDLGSTVEFCHPES